MNTTFEKSANTTDEWYTPKEIIDALGKFDLDPCAPVKRGEPDEDKRISAFNLSLELKDKTSDKNSLERFKFEANPK